MRLTCGNAIVSVDRRRAPTTLLPRFCHAYWVYAGGAGTYCELASSQAHSPFCGSVLNTGRSSGVDESGLTRETREVALAERQRAQVEEAEEVVAQAKAAEREQQAAASKRSREELRRTMDANKSAIYSIYNRELRRKPSLQGSVTPELVIEENGAVSSCSVVESPLNEPALEKKICNRLRLVDFGARPGVDRTTIRYPIELLSG